MDIVREVSSYFFLSQPTLSANDIHFFTFKSSMTLIDVIFSVFETSASTQTTTLQPKYLVYYTNNKLRSEINLKDLIVSKIGFS